MAEGDLIQTGVAGLDDILRSGIPKGNVILVEGAPARARPYSAWSSSTGASPNTTSRG
jgi:hypothetical protein